MIPGSCCLVDASDIRAAVDTLEGARRVRAHDVVAVTVFLGRGGELARVECGASHRVAVTELVSGSRHVHVRREYAGRESEAFPSDSPRRRCPGEQLAANSEEGSGRPGLWGTPLTSLDGEGRAADRRDVDGLAHSRSAAVCIGADRHPERRRREAIDVGGIRRRDGERRLGSVDRRCQRRLCLREDDHESVVAREVEAVGSCLVRAPLALAVSIQSHPRVPRDAERVPAGDGRARRAEIAVRVVGPVPLEVVRTSALEHPLVVVRGRVRGHRRVVAEVA